MSKKGKNRKWQIGKGGATPFFILKSTRQGTEKELMQQPDQATFSGLRDYGLILLQLDTGVRPGEAVQLLPEHFNLQALEVLIPTEVAKARYNRTLPYSIHTLAIVQRLILARPEEWDENIPLFASTRGGGRKGSSQTSIPR